MPSRSKPSPAALIAAQRILDNAAARILAERRQQVTSMTPADPNNPVQQIGRYAMIQGSRATASSRPR